MLISFKCFGDPLLTQEYIKQKEREFYSPSNFSGYIKKRMFELESPDAFFKTWHLRPIKNQLTLIASLLTSLFISGWYSLAYIEHTFFRE